MTLPAAPLDVVRAESTPIYGQAADAVTWESIVIDLILEEVDAGHLHIRENNGCPECAEAGWVCFIGETAVQSGGGRVVYPLSVQCPDGSCEDCAEVAQ